MVVVHETLFTIVEYITNQFPYYIEKVEVKTGAGIKITKDEGYILIPINALFNIGTKTFTWIQNGQSKNFTL